MDPRDRWPLRPLVALIVAASFGCAEGSVQSGSGDDAGADALDTPAPTDDAAPHDDAQPPPDDAPPGPGPADVLDAVTAIDVVLDAPLRDLPPVDAIDRDRAVTPDLPAPVDRTPAPDLPAPVDLPAADLPLALDTCAGLLCAGRCVDPASDPSHCGGCGRACATAPNVRPGAMRCLASTCTFAPSDCAPGFGDCDTSAANGCESNLTSATSCGACGVACAEPTPACVAQGSSSACASGCAAGLTRCGSACVLTSTDANHCGACGNRCPAPPGGSAACEAGRCVLVCPAGTHACGASCASNTSPATCGASCAPCPAVANGTATCDGVRCGVACNAGFVLVGGACVRAFCGAGVVACAGGVGCPPQQHLPPRRRVSLQRGLSGGDLRGRRLLRLCGGGLLLHPGLLRWRRGAVPGRRVLPRQQHMLPRQLGVPVQPRAPRGHLHGSAMQPLRVPGLALRVGGVFRVKRNVPADAPATLDSRCVATKGVAQLASP